MRQFQLLLLFLVLCIGSATAQSVEELKALKAEKEAAIGDLQGKIDALNGELAGINKDIDLLSGWKKGFSGLIGFDFNNSNGWISNPNPDAYSSALNIGITAFANRENEKTFWNNKGIITKSWQDVDLSEDDANAEGDGLFDNGTVDIFNLQSLGGYKMSDKFALTGMADLNTSLGNFLSPGSLDIGVGGTWLPAPNLTVVIHPLNYHVAFSGIDGLDTQGSFGAKIRADYTNSFSISGKEFNWSSTFATFIPYSNTKTTVDLGEGQTFEAGLFEYTWLNTISFEVWKGIGVGLGFGLRNSQFESTDTQSYQTLGLSYGF